jgi:hypothetical protein
MSKQELVKIITDLEARYKPPVRNFTLAANPNKDYLRFITGVRLRIWEVVSKLPKDKVFTASDVLAAYKAVPGVVITNKNPEGKVRDVLNFLARAGFVVLQKDKKAKTAVAA